MASAKDVFEKITKFIKEKKKVITPIVLSFVIAAAVLAATVPSKNSINGHYYYEEDGAVVEEVVLHINNTVEYYIYDKTTGSKKIGYNGTVTRWRCIISNTEYEEYKEKGYIASPFQIQFCNKSWGSHFQFFKVDNAVLYSKSLNTERVQKCYIKK